MHPEMMPKKYKMGPMPGPGATPGGPGRVTRGGSGTTRRMGGSAMPGPMPMKRMMGGPMPSPGMTPGKPGRVTRGAGTSDGSDGSRMPRRGRVMPAPGPTSRQKPRLSGGGY